MTTPVVVTVAGHKVAVTENRVTQGEEGHNVDDTVTTLDTVGQSATFHATKGQRIIIEELDEQSVSAMSKVETGGKISDVSQDRIDEIAGVHRSSGAGIDRSGAHD